MKPRSFKDQKEQVWHVILFGGSWGFTNFMDPSRSMKLDVFLPNLVDPLPQRGGVDM